MNKPVPLTVRAEDNPTNPGATPPLLRLSFGAEWTIEDKEIQQQFLTKVWLLFLLVIYRDEQIP